MFYENYKKTIYMLVIVEKYEEKKQLTFSAHLWKIQDFVGLQSYVCDYKNWMIPWHGCTTQDKQNNKKSMWKRINTGLCSLWMSFELIFIWQTKQTQSLTSFPWSFWLNSQGCFWSSSPFHKHPSQERKHPYCRTFKKRSITNITTHSILNLFHHLPFKILR